MYSLVIDANCSDLGGGGGWVRLLAQFSTTLHILSCAEGTLSRQSFCKEEPGTHLAFFLHSKVWGQANPRAWVGA